MKSTNTKINIRQIALPSEHGSWGFVLEPLILALLVAYSVPGLLLAVCTFFMFLSHQPIKILFKKKKNNLNKKASVKILIVYLIIIFVLFVFTFFIVEISSLIPFGLSLIVMINYLVNLYNQKNRELVAELSAPVSISLLSLSILLFNNWQIEYVIAFWFILLARSVPTTFYVHTKLQMIKKKKAQLGLPIFLGFIFTALLLVFSYLDFSPYLSVAASLILLIRTLWGLYITKGNIKVTLFGIWEFIYGGLFIVIVALGYLKNL